MNTKLITTITLALATPAFAAIGQTPTATFTLGEQNSRYTVTGPASISSGLTTITLKNTGKTPYTPVLARLKNGATEASFKAALNKLMQSHGEEIAAIDAVAEFVGGSIGLQPGTSVEYATNLASGKYVLFGFGATEDGKAFFDAGQYRTFDVTSAKNGAAAPKAAVKATLKDYKVELPATIKAGQQLWEVTNGGKETHHMVLMRLQPGKKLADVEAFFKNPNPQQAGPPPFEEAGGFETLSAGRSAFVNFNLTPGEYLVVCFLPSAKEHAPHFALGMMSTVIVK